MANHISGLDHVVIAVRDLGQAAESFRRLGFAVTAKSHDGEGGVAGHDLLLGEDRLILQVAEGVGAEADALRAFTAGREGLFAIGLRSDDGAATAECLRRAGVAVPPPRTRSRRLGDHQEAMSDVAEVVLPPEGVPGIVTRIVQPLAVSHRRPAGREAHANGATAIVSVTAIVAEPTRLAPAWDRLIGPHGAVITDDTVTVHCGRGLIFLTRPDDLSQLHPETEGENLPPPPALVALTLRVADADRAAGLLRGNGVAFSRDTEGTIRIAPEDACGVFLELAEGR